MEIKENVLEKPKRKYNKSSQVSREPTPTVGLPHPKRKQFTYSENQLLDQITTEVMYAWEKDLKTMRSHYRKLTKCIDLAEEFDIFLKAKLPILEKAMKDPNVFDEFSKFNEKLDYHQDRIQGLIVNFNTFHTKVESDIRKIFLILESKRSLSYKLYTFFTRPWWKRIFSKLDS